ncbi:MAG TPA: ATP-binding protein, partial [Anaerolineae bacterium]|nr:ATP-binding protein [Anaerolineae bacterium]
MERRLNPLEDMLGDLFVDREQELALFWEWATSIPNPALSSLALIGRRRTGKTAILVKLFNRLFWEQERVLPVFISFAHYLNLDRAITGFEFAEEYFSGYLRCYLAFRHREPMLVRRKAGLEELRGFADEKQDEFALELLHRYDGSVQSATRMTHSLVQWVINFPLGSAAIGDLPTAIIVDEFQVLTDVYDPLQGVHHDLTDSFQWAVDTKWAPLLVSGSAVSLLVRQALGGMLSGRFQYWYMKPLSREHAQDLVFRLGEVTGTAVDEELSEAAWQLTGGFPYSIHALLTSLNPARRRFPALDALEDVLIFELTDPLGQLWQHYREEFGKFSHQLNEGPVTRRVMLWATKYPGERIDAERVAREIGAPVEEVLAALDKLQWVDVVEKVGLISYQGPTDPILRRYIEYQHRVEIERLSPAEAVRDWQTEYRRLVGRVNNFIGEVAEVYVGAVMRKFDGREVDGEHYFGRSGPVTLPCFERVVRRGGVVRGGVPFEIDLTGEWD